MPAELLGLPNVYLVWAGRPKLWGQPHSRPWALDAPRGAKPRRSTPQVPEAGVFPSPSRSPGLLEAATALSKPPAALSCPPAQHSPPPGS